mmetsp:Transcript_52743/g.104772  ORF Transcript_52743/g.104772 Transcript_52743/m.104772 type:complete len:90 (+) Transcript_52743:487-756(+)
MEFRQDGGRGCDKRIAYMCLDGVSYVAVACNYLLRRWVPELTVSPPHCSGRLRHPCGNHKTDSEASGSYNAYMFQDGVSLLPAAFTMEP